MASTRFLMVAAVMLAGLAPATAETPSPDGTLAARCWTPEALAGTEKELKPHRSKETVDLAALKQEPLPAATPIPADLRGSIRSVTLPPDKKLIALTFDLCESSGDHAGYDGRIVDLLRAEGAKATFFASGKWLETHPERAQQLIADPNFEVGAHGFVHRDLSKASPAVLEDEIRLPEAAFAKERAALEGRSCAVDFGDSALQERISVMRFPYGRCNDKSLAAVADAGQLAIQWDVVTGDPDPHVTAKSVANTILKQAHPGAIVVAHANGRGRNTAAGLAIAIPKLKEEGYSFVTVSELVVAGQPVIASKCYLLRPSDARRVAHAKRRKQTNDVFSFFGGH